MASSTRKGQCEAVVHTEKTFNRGVISSGDVSECCFLLGITLQMRLLQPVKKKHRARVIEYFIDVARECFNIGNFNSLMAIICKYVH